MLGFGRSLGLLERQHVAGQRLESQGREAFGKMRRQLGGHTGDVFLHDPADELTMAGTLKKMRLTVACGYGDVGFEFTPNGTTRDWLLERGWAVIVNEVEPGGRPAKLARAAAKKIAEGGKRLFG